jgi:hypothetical protein
MPRRSVIGSLQAPQPLVRATNGYPRIFGASRDPQVVEPKKATAFGPGQQT